MGKRYAITVGINDYTECKELSFCVKDAEDMARVFTNFCDVDRENIRIITSEKTKPNKDPWGTLADVIEDLKTVFQANTDDIFFFFSGHGVPSNETTVVFKNKDIVISEINMKLEELLPKTKILIFDSCYSGKGYVEHDKSALFFSQSTKSTAGYYVLCACSDKETAKESKEISNGRFSHFLKNTISDLRNYNQYNFLDVNTLFSKVDYFFKVNPDLKQSPYQQIRSIGSYPIANNFNQDQFYIRFLVEDSLEFDWVELAQTLVLYLNSKEAVIGEFLRLVREQCDNVLNDKKGNASRQFIEVSKNKVVLIDNGNYFNLFNPQKEVKAGGGIKTANELRTLYGDFFSYSSFSEEGFNYYSFEFTILDKNELCTINVDMSSLRKLKYGHITIAEECVDYRIRFGKYSIMHSLIHMAIDNLLNEAQRTGKLIYMEFHKDDRLIADVELMIDMYGANEFIKVVTYSD